VPQPRATITRDKLIRTASELIRRKGFIATRIDDVCEIAGVTKGAFFHHFKTKEDLAEGCLIAWQQAMSETLKSAPFQKEANPTERVLGAMDLFISVLDDPKMLKSCLVGTTVQETSETHPQLRATAHDCFQLVRELFQGMLDEACRNTKATVDTASLADLWMSAVQGSLILYKASRDPAVIRRTLEHVKQYIAGYLPA
jgi:TetR/AcrR family transcriptional repressor of nem operon